MPAAQFQSAGSSEQRAEDVERYYDTNTRAFLRVGAGRHQRVIHRGVWGPGVRTREQASHYVHECLRRELTQLARDAPTLLDLGCGVGTSLTYLLQHHPDATGIGVSISPVQVALAERQAHARARFVRADFCRDPLPTPVDFAYAIEAFVHASTADAFFATVARSLRPEGRLVIVDDFLASAAQHSAVVRRFQKGWHARSLMAPEAIDRLAAAAELRLRDDRDLTPYLELNRPRDRALAALDGVLRPLASAHPWLQSLAGGTALRSCLAQGLITYRWRVWEKASLR
ncbi:MAG: cyclopropane-fatty-acyl-phospholipid synthase family protein [Vicinamibacterales bacterium]